MAITSGMTWRDAVRAVVQTLPREFSLNQVLAHRDELQRLFPNNRFVDAKIRQSLQILRDQGILQFLERGRYRRLDTTPTFSPLIDFTVAMRFASSAQAARVALETWAAFNLYCLNCESDALDRLRDNTPVADFECFVCKRKYQLKGKNGRFGPRIPGAAYAPTLHAIRSGGMPDHIFVEYDTRFGTVVFVDGVPGHSITEDRVMPRKRLSATARRAGWQGCNIVITDLPYARIVSPAGLDRQLVRDHWKML
jgi:hypothetical protein